MSWFCDTLDNVWLFQSEHVVILQIYVSWQAENAKLKKKLSFMEGGEQQSEDDVEFLKSEVIRLKGQYEQARKVGYVRCFSASCQYFQWCGSNIIVSC